MKAVIKYCAYGLNYFKYYILFRLLFFQVLFQMSEFLNIFMHF